MSTDSISIKGIRDGLTVTLGEGPLPVLRQALAEKLVEQGRFFRGGRVALIVGDRVLNTNELEELGELFSLQGMELWAILSDHPQTQMAAQDLKLGTRIPGSGAELAGSQQRAALTPPPSPMPLEGEGGLLIRGALRSGRVVENAGHVVVIGDVNPGAEIIAGGDVVVWGKLRGLVHAGAYGDRQAVVCALEMIPTQLRIADLITVSPGDPRDMEPIPEMASIKNGRIVAESWSPGYRGKR